MKETLALPIAAYLDASNGRQVETLIECFTPDAVVVDEGHTYHGAPGIQTWFAQTVEAYDFTLEAIDVAAQGSEAVVTFQVSGTFDGSPIQVPFRFTLEGDKITALTIR
jgi:ketosteroid isomerase-like protein